jgi:SAM-dependent methyltransferase
MPLAYYARAATEAFWTEHWGGQDTSGLVDIARTSPLTAIIEAALPASGRILEAGCGLGQYVVLMRERGRCAIGADWSVDALLRCRAAAPGTPLAAMDLARLAVHSASVDAYVSLGVVEHDPAGPGRLLEEAARVLAPRGRLIVSVPYWNGVRKLGTLHLRRAGRRVRASGGEFYQFAFSRREVRAALEAHGFRVLSFHPYDPARMMRPLLRRIAGKGTRGAGAAAPAATPGRDVPALRRMLYSGPVLRMCAHMILAVAERA